MPMRSSTSCSTDARPSPSTARRSTRPRAPACSSRSARCARRWRPSRARACSPSAASRAPRCRPRPSSTTTPPSRPTTRATSTAPWRSRARGWPTGPTTRSSTTSWPASTLAPAVWTTRGARWTSPSPATSARAPGRPRTRTSRRCARAWGAPAVVRSALGTLLALKASPRGSEPGRRDRWQSSSGRAGHRRMQSCGAPGPKSRRCGHTVLPKGRPATPIQDACARASRPSAAGLPSLGDAFQRSAAPPPPRGRLTHQPLELRQRGRCRRVMHHGHPELARRVEVEGEVVDEDARARLGADALRAELVHARIGLAEALLARDDDAVEELGQEVARVAARAPGVRDQAGGDAAVVEGAHALDHRVVEGSAGEEAVDEPLVPREAEGGREPRLEVDLLDAPAFEVDEQRAGVAVVTEEVGQDLGLEALVGAEGPKRAEQVAGHHAAPVEQDGAALSRHGPAPPRGRRAG